MEMAEEEYSLYQARKGAAQVYMAEGYSEFAQRVERGEADDCALVRLGRFFREPTPAGLGFNAAWDDLSLVEAAAQ